MTVRKPPIFPSSQIIQHQKDQNRENTLEIPAHRILVLPEIFGSYLYTLGSCLDTDRAHFLRSRNEHLSISLRKFWPFQRYSNQVGEHLSLIEFGTTVAH